MWSNLLTETSLCGPLTVVRLKGGWGRGGGEEKEESRAKSEAARGQADQWGLQGSVKDYGLRPEGNRKKTKGFGFSLKLWLRAGEWT